MSPPRCKKMPQRRLMPRSPARSPRRSARGQRSPPLPGQSRAGAGRLSACVRGSSRKGAQEPPGTIVRSPEEPTLAADQQYGSSSGPGIADLDPRDGIESRSRAGARRGRRDRSAAGAPHPQRGGSDRSGRGREETRRCHLQLRHGSPPRPSRWEISARSARTSSATSSTPRST